MSKIFNSRNTQDDNLMHTPQPVPEPLEELILELSDLKLHEENGTHRVTASARIVYEPATSVQPAIYGTKSWSFIAPMGPIDAEELKWYLESYANSPDQYFKTRAEQSEKDIIKWGQLLYESALPPAYTDNVMQAWAKVADNARRRFSVHVDNTLEEGATKADGKLMQEAAATLLALPWELLHDGKQFMFQSVEPTLVRRRIPSAETFNVPVVSTPVRILLVTARPEDDLCNYIDHRASALPLAEAMEMLPGIVETQVLDLVTFSSLRKELERGRAEGKPYHVVHFDGHGIYDPSAGIGGLCFEHPDDTRKLSRRRHAAVFADELGSLLYQHHIPLVFLNVCHTPAAEHALGFIASEMLKMGVPSIVAMNRGVQGETMRRFITAFYKTLTSGKPVGDAMLAGQLDLKDNALRGQTGEVRLEDWFVPVLFQEKNDPQLFSVVAAKQTIEDFKAEQTARLGELPQPPKDTGFIGRSRELLALQRLLQTEPYAVICGQSGEGKTSLAVEFACWMVRSLQMQRVAFVSVEPGTSIGAMLDALGRQLVGKNYSVAAYKNLDEARLPLERVLSEQSVLLVIDDMENILLPSYMAQESDPARELAAILNLCERLNATGNTRLIFASREPLPAPFDGNRNRRELHQPDLQDVLSSWRAVNAFQAVLIQ